MKLADITKHVDHLISHYAPALERIVGGMTAEERYVAALFDCDDDVGMQLYYDLRLGPEGKPGTYRVLDVLHQPLLDELVKRSYEPIDELPSYEAGTVLLYVFTRGVVVVRRFEAFAGERGLGAARRVRTLAGVRERLREVRRVRAVEFEPTGLRLEGDAALHLILQRCAETLRSLWDGSNERVAIIQSTSYGARAGYVGRSVTIGTLRDLATHSSSPQCDSFRAVADALASAPEHGEVQCVFWGWGTVELLPLTASSLAVPSGARPFGKRDEDLLGEYIVACRDQKRALGVFESCLDKLRSPPISTSVAELLAVLRHQWNDPDAILAQIPIVTKALGLVPPTGATTRLQLTLSALWQATTERKRGAAMNAPGGSA